MNLLLGLPLFLQPELRNCRVSNKGKLHTSEGEGGTSFRNVKVKSQKGAGIGGVASLRLDPPVSLSLL